MSSRVLASEELETHEISEFPYHRSPARPVQSPSSREMVGSESRDDQGRAAFERGYKEGENAALAAAEARLAPARERLLATVQELSGLRRHLFLEAEKEIIELAVTIASKIVRREVRLDHDIVATLVRISLEKLSQATTSRVRLNPDDYRYLASALAEGKHDGFGNGVVLAEDERVEAGGCIIDTDAGTADARLEVQLQEAAASLLSTF
jgi:flagellar assembly protein FliH